MKEMIRKTEFKLKVDPKYEGSQYIPDPQEVYNTNDPKEIAELEKKDNVKTPQQADKKEMP